MTDGKFAKGRAAPVEAALFDFDGTLLDTSEGIFKSLRHAFAAGGRPEPDDRELRRFIGPPIRDALRRFYGCSEEETAFLITKYREHYADKGLWYARVYKGVPELLQALNTAGLRLAIASSKPVIFIELLLKKYDLYRYFTHIGGVRSDTNASGKAGIIREGLRALNVRPASALMVGDRKYDIDAARETGLSCLAVLYGFGSLGEFREHGAAFVAHTPEEVQKIILGG